MSEESFEKLLEENGVKTIRTGDVVDGYVIAVTNNEVKVDLGNKCTGTIKIEDVTDDPSVSLEDRFKVGDMISAIAVRVSDIDGIVVLNTKKIEAINSWNTVKEAKENNTTLEGKVVEANKGGVVVRVNSQRIFVPASQTGLPKDADINTLVGTTQKLKVLEIKDGRKIVGSIKKVLNEELKEKRSEFWSTIEVGKHYEGVVKNLTSYGVFVDLGGVDGMVHSTELSWKHVANPKDFVSVGDKLDVFVKSFDAEKGRISLGHRTDETNPWNIFKENYKLDDVISVTVSSIMPYGAFATIIDGIDGLIHISQIANKKLKSPADVLKKGQVVDAKIVGIDEEQKRVSLSIRALLPEEEQTEEVEEAAEEVTEAPVEETPAAETPVEEAPAEETPVETAPTETTEVVEEAPKKKRATRKKAAEAQVEEATEEKAE
jgi:4-hydroxy-3-methylbut-2-enyl diphosphate reductase